MPQSSSGERLRMAFGTENWANGMTNDTGEFADHFTLIQ